MKINSVVRKLGQFTVPNPPYGDTLNHEYPNDLILKAG